MSTADSQLTALARDLPPHLEPGWQLDGTWLPSYRGVRLAGAGGQLLHLAAIPRSGRLRIRGVLPTPVGHGGSSEITVRADRDARAIAGEITRRLLPGYRAALAPAQNAAAERAEDRRRRNDLARQVTVPDAIIEETDFPSTVVHWFGAPGAERGSVRFIGDGSSADLTLHGIPGHVAVDLLTRLVAASADV